MADRVLIAAIILAGLINRHPAESPNNLISSAVEAADKLIDAVNASPGETVPLNARWQGDEPPPGTP
jgi:hypothetical protein